MESLDTFYRRNDIGVRIEYTIIGYYKDKFNYRIYTDFTTDKSNNLGISLYVDKEDNGDYIPVADEERKNIIIAFNKEIINYNKK